MAPCPGTRWIDNGAQLCMKRRQAQQKRKPEDSIVMLINIGYLPALYVALYPCTLVPGGSPEGVHAVSFADHSTSPKRGASCQSSSRAVPDVLARLTSPL
jgi:hypothetical protein